RRRRVRSRLAVDFENAGHEVDDPVVLQTGARVQAALLVPVEVQAGLSDFDDEDRPRRVLTTIVAWTAWGHRKIRLGLRFVVERVGPIAAAHPRPSSPAKPEGEMRYALYVTLAPTWFDPGENTAGFLTPFWILYALHDALVKPMPGNLMAPSLAESWTVSADQ